MQGQEQTANPRHSRERADARRDVDVLVVGAGPAGLITAIGLARYGVSVLLVERHEGTSVFPRATVISVRSMEILRSWGLEPQVRRREFPALPLGRVAPTLVESEGVSVSLGFPTEEEARQVSPTTYALAAQDAFEPVLLDHLRGYPTDIRFGTELVAFDQDDDGVTSVVRHRGTGRPITVRSRFLVAADGGRSTVRSALGINMDGPEHLEEYVSTLFRAPLSARIGRVPHGLNMIPGPNGMAVFLPTSADDRWVFAQTWDPRTQRVEDFDRDRVTKLIRAASGVPDLPADIMNVAAFSFAAQVADSFRAGNVFLVGDAAHRITPRGGTGMNTAIHDAHNLAWKLAFVLRGWAGPDLLDSYEIERRPVDERNTARSATVTGEEVDPLAIDVGVTYGRGALVPDGSEGPYADRWRPNGSPGARLPHVWLDCTGTCQSTLDLVGDGLTLLTGPEGARWRQAARRATTARGPRVDVRTVGGDDGAGSVQAFLRFAGIEQDGALLVRPDGHIAWRARSTVGLDVPAVLTTVIGAVLAHGGSASGLRDVA
jgi:2-polyprenyl-6-methoxyphenol hydroxylase-like FAD-dependent oxidoreductase